MATAMDRRFFRIIEWLVQRYGTDYLSEKDLMTLSVLSSTMFKRSVDQAKILRDIRILQQQKRDSTTARRAESMSQINAESKSQINWENYKKAAGDTRIMWQSSIGIAAVAAPYFLPVPETTAQLIISGVILTAVGWDIAQTIKKIACKDAFNKN